MSINKKTFCLAPWFSVFLNSDKAISPCCKFKTSKHNYHQIEEYFHSEHLNKVRHDLLNGVKNENCSRCWIAEENGGDSMRLISNRTLGKSSKVSIFDQIKDPKLSNVQSFDLTLGNLCNLKCVMCNPGVSSQLLAEVNLNKGLQANFKGEFKQKDFDWPKQDNFVDWCNKHLPQAIHIKFTGGEPFIIPWIQTVIDKIPDEQKKKCILHFTTNLTIVNLGLFENFRKFKEVWLSVSVEGIKETHEYLRYGHKWETLETNIRLIQEMQIPNLMLNINHVVQTASYHSIIPMTEYFDNHNIQIHPILLTNPAHFHISSLTKYAKEKFLSDTVGYAGYNDNFIKFVRSASREYLDQDTTATKQCLEYLQRFDHVRGNSYKEIIPGENIHA